MDLHLIFLYLAILLFTARLSGDIFAKFSVPSVMGKIFAGYLRVICGLFAGYLQDICKIFARYCEIFARYLRDICRNNFRAEYNYC